MLVVCSHLPGEGHFRSERYQVAPICCAGDFDYWQGINAHWTHPGALVLVEHDIEVTDRHLTELGDCPHPLCSWAYACHWASTGLPHDVIAAGSGHRDPETNPDPEYLVGGEEWANWSAIGLVKIAPEARIGPLRCEPWQRLELAVHDAVRRPWHMHWPPVNHWHW